MAEVREKYMMRALQIAKLGAGKTAPNPLVGAVLVYEDTIIGEGYHQKYGEAHAEVNCIKSVSPEHRELLSKSTLYVTLEPCSHFGKTPPCADLLIKQNIPEVAIGSSDPNPQVAGEGIQKLKAAGIGVVTKIKEPECLELNKRFFTFHKKRRPFILLKWAQSPDGFIALPGKKPVRISNTITDRIVHRWRSEESGILIGSQTALSDNPKLTNRLWSGASPIRLVIDRVNQLPDNLHLLKDERPTLIFNFKINQIKGNKEWIQLKTNTDFLNQLLETLYRRNIQSILVEGGATLLQTFFDKNLWDEARLIKGTDWLIKGIPAPKLSSSPSEICSISTDTILTFKNFE